MQARDEKLQQIMNWAKDNNDIRLMMLTSSLVNPLAPVDDFSDLDVELVFEDIDPYQFNHQWTSLFGKPISMVEEDETFFDNKHAMKMVLYDDHVKVDFKLYKKAAFINDALSDTLPEDWDIGYKVLVDKDDISHYLKAPTYQSTIIQQPTEKKFTQVMNDCWWDMTYVAKCLARDEIFYAKFMTENMIRTDYLVPIIEWYIASENNWGITTNKHGRLFKKYLSPDLWNKIEATFSGSNMEDNWNALFAYADLIHQLGMTLSEKLRYDYPTELEHNIRKYLTEVRSGQQ